MKNAGEGALSGAGTSRMQIPPLEDSAGSLTGIFIDHLVPCTAMDKKSCQIVQKLPTLNELLFPSHFELRELPDTSGKLSLACFSHYGVRVPDSAESEALQGVELIYWLLTTHRCIVHLRARLVPSDCHTVPLCKALQRNLWLKTVKLQLLGFSACHEVCAAIVGLPSLEELHLTMYRQCPAELASALSILLLRVSAPLVSLKLNGTLLVGRSNTPLLTALTRNSTLKELDVTGSLVCESLRARFAEYLTFNTSLTTLSMGAGSEPVQRALLEGVLRNRTISKLSIRYFVGNEESAQLIARIFRENTVLRSFNILSTNDNRTPQHESVYDCWLDALAENCTLEELTVPFLIWHPVKWTSFSQTLSTKLTLKKLNVAKESTNYSFLPSICAALTDSGADEKVSLGRYVVEHNLDLIKCKAFSEIYLFSNGFEHVRITALRELPNCDHLTLLAMDVTRGDTALSSALADFLTSMSCGLRKLQLSVGWEPPVNGSQLSPWWTTILNSVARNTSIKEISVSMVCMDEQEFMDLADALKCNRSVRTVHVSDDTHGSPSAFVRRLSVDIADNYTLLRVCLNGGLDEGAKKEWFSICETTRRNWSVLARAARFAQGGHIDRYVAAAVERISQHPSLLGDIAELACKSKAEVSASIADCVRSIQPMGEFMRLTGVVKERVTCHRRDDRRMQLDELYEHCWSIVRRHLMLEDVKDDAAQSVRI